MAWSQANLRCLQIMWSQYQPTSPTFSLQNPNRGTHDLCHLNLPILCAHLQAALQPIFTLLANMKSVCGVPDWDCLKLFQMHISWFYLFTGISLGWFGFISFFFKYYRDKFGVISFVVSLYELLCSFNSFTALYEKVQALLDFNNFRIKSHHGGQELLHKKTFTTGI